MTRLLRDLAAGAAFAVGAMLARALAVPALITFVIGSAWASGWALLHHVPWLAGARHVIATVEHAARVALASRRVGR